MLRPAGGSGAVAITAVPDQSRPAEWTHPLADRMRPARAL